MRMLLALLGMVAVCSAYAAEPPARGTDACMMLNNRVLGPRTKDRPLPLMVRDDAQAFHYACSAKWSALSPKNAPLPVLECFHGTLLQIAEGSACGNETRSLWVSTRWVLTSADLQQPVNRIAVCQQLETGAWAGTRDFSVECAQRAGAAADSHAPSKAPVTGAVAPAAAKPADAVPH